MATPITTIHIVHEPTNATQSVVNDLVPNTTDQQGIVARLINFFNAILGGIKSAKLLLSIESRTAGDTFANGTATITHANLAADDTLKLGGTTLTWKVAAGNENEVTIGADATADATALKNAINAHSVLGKFFTATSAAAVVTVTAKLPGLIGTLMGWAANDNWAALTPTAALGNVTSTQTQTLITVNRGLA